MSNFDSLFQTEEDSLQLPFSQSHAFLVGIDAYEHITPLRTAVKDASDIADLLSDIDKHAYQVHLFTDASKSMMEECFALMQTVVQAEDRVLFYFAGHGIALDSEKDPEGYLVPLDAKSDDKDTLVKMDRLHEVLLSLPCKHGLLVLDCCFAGSFKWSTGSRSEIFDFGQTLYAERFWRYVEHPAWQVITSSAHDQKAADLLDKQALGLREEEMTDTQNSPFAWAFKQAIDLHSKADTSGRRRSDGIVTVTELFLYLQEVVLTASQNAKRQSPALFSLESKHDSKGEYIFINPGHKLNLPKAPFQNPYKGLVPYENNEQDAKTFFGRTLAIEEMQRRLNKTSILVVSAPSGQGKSSAVKAGLIPKLKSTLVAEPIILRPSDGDVAAWNSLKDLAPSQSILVVIDQYEELFSLELATKDVMEKALLDLVDRIQAFSEGREKRLSSLKLIITIRADFDWQLESSKIGQGTQTAPAMDGLPESAIEEESQSKQGFWKSEAIRHFLYRLPPMSREELREMMLKPAWVVAYDFESDELVEQILDEIHHAPGALPLLSFTLNKLFEHRDKPARLLTQDAYDNRLKGVNGALSSYADEVYEGLKNAAEKDFMRKLMLRMIQLNDGSYSRRKAYLKVETAQFGVFINELDYPDHLDATKDAVLKKLEDSLLLIVDPEGRYVEPMHDSLINYWPRCLQWIQDFGRDNLVLQRDLWKAVVEHHSWVPDFSYGAPEEGATNAPLWDNNPKLQQVQIAVSDPRKEWLCQAGKANKNINDLAFLLWESKPIKEQLTLLAPWAEYFDATEDQGRFDEVQTKMDHWLNEKELDFVRRSFEQQRSELERIIAERNEAIKAKEKAEALALNMGKQTVAFKQKYQNRAKRDLKLIELGMKPRLFMIMVGINDYPPGIPDLSSCIQDVENLSKAFKAQEGLLYEAVIIQMFIDGEATETNIINKVREYREQATEFDYVFIMLSGHGTLEKAEGFEDKKIGAFLTYSAGNLDRLTGYELCDELLQFHSTVILMTEFCHGSEFIAPLAEANLSQDIEKLTNSVFAISACSPGQTAGETNEGGFLSLAIKKCFEKGAADLDGNNMVYLDELYQFATQFISKMNETQVPISIIPATLNNIPLIQLGEKFAYPINQLALSGHIEDDEVIGSILGRFASPSLIKRLAEQGYHYSILSNLNNG